MLKAHLGWGMRHRCPALPIILVFVGLLGFTRPSSAQESSSSSSAVVIIDAGTADLFVESLVRSTVEAELVKSGYTIVSGVSVGGDTPAKLLACSGDLACAAGVMSEFGSRYVIFLSLRTKEPGESADFKIVARSFEVATGRVLARIMRRCQLCTEDLALASFSEELVRDLVQEATHTSLPEPGTFSEPSATLPPPHQSVDMVPPPSRPEPGFSWLPLATYASLGAGIAAIAGGTILVLVDGPVIENRRRQPKANDTLGLGLVSLGTGAALVGLSAWLWSQRANDSSTNSSLVLGARSDGAVLGYKGAF